MAAASDSEEIFNDISVKFMELLHIRTEADRSFIEKSLDDLNSLNYKEIIVKNNAKAVLLINQCCSLISPEERALAVKNCQLIKNLIHTQDVSIEGSTLTLVINWCLDILKFGEDSILTNVLVTLDAIIRNSQKYQETLIPDVIREDGPILNLLESNNSAVVLLVLQCVEACASLSWNGKASEAGKITIHSTLCCKILKNILIHRPKYANELIYCKILITCLKGLQNIITQNKEILMNEIGDFLGIIKSYIVYGIDDIGFLVPMKVAPSAFSIPEPIIHVKNEKKGGKVTKQRKHRTNDAEPCKPKEWIDDEVSNQYMPVTPILNCNSDGGTRSNTLGKLNASDSDFSDSECGRSAKLSVNYSQIRQMALNLLFHIIKFAERNTVFSYWSSIIPENSLCGKHNLMTSILKDPSPKARLAALNALLLLISSSKIFLAQAESSEKSTAFTPFSVILGLTIKEIHRCLSLALSENSVPILTQVLKCFAALVQATPYSRLSTGLLTKTIRNIKTFLYHRDFTVQVGALIVMGCIVAYEPVLPETKEVLAKCSYSHTNRTFNLEAGEDTNDKNVNLESFDYVNFSSDEDLLSAECESKIPWIMEKCLTNLDFSDACTENKNSENQISIPVKLESLQVLSAMSRNYFEIIMVPHIKHLTKALDIALRDKNMDLKLHAGRAVDFIGQAVNNCLINEAYNNSLLSIEQATVFWQTLLDESLLNLLNNEHNSNLRAVGCDCIGSIGSLVFGYLPRKTQIICATSLFSRSRDEENSVRGAAIRALAICVTYQSLREDIGFVVDTAASIHSLMQDSKLPVRVKASWAAGNLSDVLVLNRSDKKNYEDFPLSLLLVLIHSCIIGSSDGDKVKMNSVRALGNFMQFIKINCFLLEDLKNEFISVVELSIKALVRCASESSSMKVRWNACYALGNVLKNRDLYYVITWQEKVYEALMDLVIKFHNFKVRINAALALSCPIERKMYKQYYHSVWKALLEALEESQNLEDFTEYKHKDHLVEQICLSLAHLTTLLTKEDLLALQDILISHTDSFKVHMKKVYDRLIPEKSTVLFSAATFLKTLSEDPSLNTLQRSTQDILSSVFIQDF